MVNRAAGQPEAGAPVIYRHAIVTRVTHWITVLCLPILVMSGLQIFNAHPALYWGDRSDRDRPLLALHAEEVAGQVVGVTTLFGLRVETTGWLGASRDAMGMLEPRGFPRWSTLPGGHWLAMGRRWHLFFAWLLVITGLLFTLYTVLGRHLRRDLLPGAADLRTIGRTAMEHLTFHRPRGATGARYNVLQKLTYVGVIFGLGPLIVVTGLAMSPSIDAAFPPLTALFGGRQSARTVHFVGAFAFVAFTLVHLFMVAVTGAWNNVRSIVIGWYRIPSTEGADDRPR